MTGDNTCQLVNTLKNKRNDLSLKQKYYVVQVATKNPKFGIRKLALDCKCGKTQIAQILKKKNQIVALYCEEMLHLT